jgi:hypothetical protein
MAASLVNDLGTGLPKLIMKLANSGDKWTPYDLDYKQVGNVPGGGDKDHNWSAWNVVDEKKNWYGTVSLTSDGVHKIWLGDNFYKPPSVTDPNNYNRLQGLSLSELPGTLGKYKLTLTDVYPSFPFADRAKPAVYPGTTERIVLSTDGPKIVNNRGADVVLKGVTRPSLEWPAPIFDGEHHRLGYHGQWLSPSDIKTMRGWGANVIRIPLNQAFWLNSKPREVIGSYKQIVDAMIYYAIEQNMAVILDLHRLLPDPPEGKMANTQSIDFWTDVAKTYATFGTVLFELFNEPHNLAQDKWLNGDKQYAGYQQLYNAVRGAGANNLCIIGGLDWAYDLSFVKSDFGVKGTNIVYCSHPYHPQLCGSARC